MKPALNVRAVIDEIHGRVEREGRSPANSSNTSGGVNYDLTTLRAAYGRLYEIRNLVGQMPPQPATTRARIGARLVRLVQRMLFWYTPQILRFHNETALVLGELCKIVEKQSDSIGDAQKEITAQRREREFESRPGTGTSDLARSPASFDFSLQDYFRGPETDTSEKLKGWLDAIEGEGLSGRRLDGPWLDIGCGRGEWLSLASQRGYDISGVDSSPVSVGYCKSKGARVSHADAIGYLRGLADNSLAVATAFHVVEHLKMDTLATLIALAAQKLRPDGILAIETPDPANLLMSSHHFWNDPTHERPIPRALMEYVFQHFGFSVLRRLRLNPFPPEERLSHTEFEPVRRVDELLYGPRDYGLIGRRES